MIIENITFNEKNMTFIIELSTEEKLKVSYEIYEALELKKEMDLSSDLYNTLLEEDSFIKAKEIAVRFVNYKPRTRFEVERKLRMSKITDSNINKTLNYLEDKGYLDDIVFAKEFIRQCIEYKNFSLKKTKLKLYQKGIDKSISDGLLANFYDEDLEKNNALKIAQKKARNLDLDEYKDQQKLYSYLVSNGFSYNLAKSCIDELKRDINE